MWKCSFRWDCCFCNDGVLSLVTWWLRVVWIGAELPWLCLFTMANLDLLFVARAGFPLTVKRRKRSASSATCCSTCVGFSLMIWIAVWTEKCGPMELHCSARDCIPGPLNVAWPDICTSVLYRCPMGDSTRNDLFQDFYLRHFLEVSKSGLRSFTDLLCFLNLVIRLDSLELFTFFTQVKDGPHTIYYEHTPTCHIHWKISSLLKKIQIESTCSG